MRPTALNLFVLAAALCACTTTKLSTKDQTDVATYAGEQSACVAATPGDKAAIDSCRTVVKERWCAHWRGTFDAEVCP